MNLAMSTGGLDWSSQTKIFPSLFPVKDNGIKPKSVNYGQLHDAVVLSECKPGT